jgi:hypothetical protein
VLAATVSTSPSSGCADAIDGLVTAPVVFYSVKSGEPVISACCLQ